MRVFGADFSHWEEIIDYSIAVQFLPFCYYKATDGIYYIDVQLGNNMDGCNEYGIPHAPYHWWQETQDPIKQAQHFYDATKEGGYKQYIIDVEPSVNVPGMANKLKQLLDEMQSLIGKKPAIYTSAYYWDAFIKANYINQYDVLVANYRYGLNPKLPAGCTKWVIWQNTDYFWFPGCDERADGNWFNGTLEECRAWFGNYHPYNQVPQPPSYRTQMKVISSQVNIRTLPSVSAPIIGKLLKDDVIEVCDVGGTDAWIKHSNGWSAYYYSGLKYLEPI